jgi:hypothetical protein
MARQQKPLPELRPCKCGDIGITLRPRGGRWSVHCLSPACDCMVRGFATEREAILAWNKEVQKHDTAGKRH